MPEASHPPERCSATKRTLLVGLIGVLVLGACTSGADRQPDAGEPPTAAAGAVDEQVTADEDVPVDAEATVDQEVTWRRGPDAPLALTEVAVAALGDQVWVVGGLTAEGLVVPDVQVYDTVAGQWRSGPPLPSPVHHAAIVSTGDALVVLGGYPTTRLADPVATTWVGDGEAWIEGMPLPEPRAAGAAAWDGQQIVYGGGVGADGQPAGDVWTGGPQVGWTALGEQLTPREHLAAALSDAGVAFLGGRTSDMRSNLGVVEVVRDGRVEQAGQVPATAGIAGFSVEGNACVVGGEEVGGTIATVACADGRRLPDLQVPRHGHGAVVVDDQLHVLLGGDEPGLSVTPVLEILSLTGG